VLVRDVVADYSERSLTSALPPIAGAQSVVRDVLDRVFVARRGRSELTTTVLAPGQLADLVERMLARRDGGSTCRRRSSTRCCPTAPGCTW
jgi:pilus assembly protein CpaF